MAMVKNIKVKENGDLSIKYPNNMAGGRIEVAKDIVILAPDKYIHAGSSSYEFSNKRKLTVCINNKVKKMSIEELLPLIDFNMYTVTDDDYEKALYVPEVEYEYLTMGSTYMKDEESEFVNKMLDKLKDYRLILVEFHHHSEYMYAEEIIKEIELLKAKKGRKYE